MSDLYSYKSIFLPNTEITVIFKENPNYFELSKYFDVYGY